MEQIDTAAREVHRAKLEQAAQEAAGGLRRTGPSDASRVVAAAPG
ncbi:hypothetical protein L083_4648 [Actinoplanes sp. N902-109]|nr:hypothetical protein L083_4648 [Actinoplanes sp. N902-109]